LRTWHIPASCVPANLLKPPVVHGYQYLRRHSITETPRYHAVLDYATLSSETCLDHGPASPSEMPFSYVLRPFAVQPCYFQEYCNFFQQLVTCTSRSLSFNVTEVLWIHCWYKSCSGVWASEVLIRTSDDHASFFQWVPFLELQKRFSPSVKAVLVNLDYS
jgi:hypothetical protein